MGKEQGAPEKIVWKTGIDNPLYLVGAAGFAVYATLALTGYALSRLIHKLPKLPKLKTK